MYKVGVDVGGTNLAAGILAPDRSLIQKLSVPFPGADRPMDSIAAMAALIRRLLETAGISGSDVDNIGLAVPGSIDYTQKRVINAYNLGYHDFPLAELLQVEFPQVRMDIENDANAAALAEYYCGAFRGAHSGALITLGTGVGGGLILDDRLFIGGCKNGFELGHTILVDGGEACTCGNRGCFEAYCSATALIREGRRAAEADPQGMIAVQAAASGKLDAKLVIDCAKQNDPAARQIFDAYIGHLGSGIASIINTLDPEIVAIGGGVSNAGDFLFVPLRENVRTKVFYDSYADIRPAQTGNDAGIIGAAMLSENRA